MKKFLFILFIGFVLFVLSGCTFVKTKKDISNFKVTENVTNSLFTGVFKKISPLPFSGEKITFFSKNFGFKFSLPLSCKGKNSFDGSFYSFSSSKSFFQENNEIFCDGIIINTFVFQIPSHDILSGSFYRNKIVQEQNNDSKILNQENLLIHDALWQHLEMEKKDIYGLYHSGVIYYFIIRYDDENLKNLASSYGLSIISEFTVPYIVSDQEYYKNDIYNIFLIDQFNQKHQFPMNVGDPEYGPYYTVVSSQEIQSIKKSQWIFKNNTWGEEFYTVNKKNKENIFNRFISAPCFSGLKSDLLIYEVKNSDIYLKKFLNNGKIILEGDLDLILSELPQNFCLSDGLFVNVKKVNSYFSDPGIYYLKFTGKTFEIKNIMTGNFLGALLLKDLDQIIVLDHEGNLLKKDLNN